MAGEPQINGEQMPKPPAHQMADEFADLMSRWARTGLVQPKEVAELLIDTMAQTMAFSVPPGLIEQATNDAMQFWKSRINHHVARMAHLRTPAPEPERKN